MTWSIATVTLPPRKRSAPRDIGIAADIISADFYGKVSGHYHETR